MDQQSRTAGHHLISFDFANYKDNLLSRLKMRSLNKLGKGANPSTEQT